MNRSRAAEANKHTLDVCQALIARGGLIKHVVHRGNSCLYVCLPALFELYLQNHGVFIPSFTAYVRSLSSDLAQTDRIHPQRFPPHFQKAAAVTFKWPAERRDLPAAEELAQLLHLNDQIEQQPQQEAVSGAESGKISWGHRIQAKPRSSNQQQQQQAVAGAAAGGKDAGAASAAADGVAAMDAHWCVVDSDAPAAATAAALDVSQPGAAGADQAVKQSNGQPGSTSSSSSSLLEGQPQQQRKRSPSAAAAGAAPGAAAAADGAATVVQESPFIAKRQRDDSPEQQQQQQQQQQEEQRPAKLPKQLPAAADSLGNANMLTFPLSSVALVTQQQQQQQQQSPTQRQQTPKQQQALGPGSHLLNKHTPPKNHTPQQQHKVGQLLPPKARPLPAGMHVHKLRQLQQPPTWLQPYQLPPLPPQQQQQQLQPPPASRPVVKRLPAGMRVGNMSHQGRLQLLTWLLKGRPDRIQQMKQQQQQAAAAGADGFPAKQKQEEPGKTVQQQQQQQLSASQVQLLQASLRKRQQELTQQQQQQQQGSALRNGRLSAAGFAADVKQEGLAAAPHNFPSEQQQQQQQDEEEDCVQRASTTEAQQEVERLQQELQQLQDMLLNQGQGQQDAEQPNAKPDAAAPAAQQQQRKRAAADDFAVQPPPKQQQQQQQQQQQGKQKQARAGPARVFHHSLLSAAEVAEVQALLSAMCVLVGATGAQQLVAGIDVQLAASSSSKEQQQKRRAAGCDCSSLQCMCSPAEDAVEQQQQQQQAGGMNRDVLLALRSLALAFGQQQQGLRVPTLQNLAQDAPCLLDGTSALDGQQLLCLSESQLQGFFAAVLDSELQRAVHAARRQQQQQQQQQQKGQQASGSAAQQQQKQQQLAAELMAAYKAGRGEVVVRPRTLMLVTGQRLVAAAQQVPQLPPLQQTPLAAAVAGCLAEREVQLLHIRQQDAAVTGLHLLNAFMLRSKFDQRLAGQRQLALDMPGQCAVLAAAAGTCSQLRVSTVPAAVFAFPLLQEQQMASAAAEEAGSGDAVLSSWLFVAPELAAWQQLVQQLQELKKQRQQQQQQSSRRLATLQQCKAQAEELLLGLQLQPRDLAWLQQQLNQARPAEPAPAAAAAAVKEEPMPDAAAAGGASSVPQQQVAVLLQQQAGQAVQVKPGWLHVAVNHAANVKVWMEFVRPADVAACAAAQHALQQGADSSSGGGGGAALGGAQLGPVLLTVLQQWCAYCHQQERLLRQQQQQQQY